MKYLPLLLLLTGCPINREKYDRTPAGWHVHWIDQGSLSTGLHTKAELLALFDSAMERSFPECAAKVGLSESYVRSKIKRNDALYTLIDNFYFAVDPGSADAPSAVYASGLTSGRTHVTVAFYNRLKAVDLASVPVDAPPWTIRPDTSDTQVSYGWEVDGMQYPALSFEMHWQFTDIP